MWNGGRIVAKKGRFELNTKAVGKELNGAPMEADLKARLGRVKAAFGDGLEISTQKGRTRIQASAITTSRAAARREEKSRALTRAATEAGGSSGKR